MLGECYDFFLNKTDEGLKLNAVQHLFFYTQNCFSVFIIIHLLGNIG